ncbi:MAG: hypothetical protein ACE5EI_01235, partial [Thermodesulfobacteriota bacterium]
MKILDRLTVSQKMMLPGAIVIIGFLAVMLIYRYGHTVQERAEARNRATVAFSRTIDAMQVKLLEARRLEKDFLLHNRAEYIDRHAETAKEIEALFGRLKEQAPDQATLATLRQAEKDWQAYRAGFRETSSEKVRLGLDENSGLLGRLRGAVHDVEQILKDHPDLALANSMLMMRRHEKDYLAREGDRYVDLMAKEQARFAGLLKRSALSPAVKREIAGRMDRYRSDFAALVEGTKRVRRKMADFRANVQAMEGDIKGLLAGTESIIAANETAQKQQHDTLHRVARFFYLSLAVIAIFVLLPLVILTRDVSSLVARVYSSGISVASSVTEIAASTREQ